MIQKLKKVNNKKVFLSLKCIMRVGIFCSEFNFSIEIKKKSWHKNKNLIQLFWYFMRFCFRHWTTSKIRGDWFKWKSGTGCEFGAKTKAQICSENVTKKNSFGSAFFSSFLMSQTHWKAESTSSSSSPSRSQWNLISHSSSSSTESESYGNLLAIIE